MVAGGSEAGFGSARFGKLIEHENFDAHHRAELDELIGVIAVYKRHMAAELELSVEQAVAILNLEVDPLLRG